jgi:hypothetical protein
MNDVFLTLGRALNPQALADEKARAERVIVKMLKRKSKKSRKNG